LRALCDTFIPSLAVDLAEDDVDRHGGAIVQRRSGRCGPRPAGGDLDRRARRADRIGDRREGDLLIEQLIRLVLERLSPAPVLR